MQDPSDPDYPWENLHFPSLAAKALSEGAGEVLVFGFLSLVRFQDTFPVACPFRVYLQAQTPFCTCYSCPDHHSLPAGVLADAVVTLVARSHPDRKADSALEWQSS